MATITTRSGKGSALTHQEVDANFTGLNTELGQKELASNKGVANGYASLDAAGKVPSAQLPSYVDDVVEAANLASLPGTGETGKIYVTLDTNKTYRWSGSAYVEISPSPGSTDSLAEGSTNLYFTQARARASVSASGSLSYNSSTGVFSFSDAVTSVAGRTGAVTLTSSDVGLGSVENKSSATIRGELTSGNVTTALGFTPYNATNPSGYITSSALSSYLPLSGGTVSGQTRFTGNDNQVIIDGTTGGSASAAGLFFALQGALRWENYHYNGALRWYNYTNTSEDFSINNSSSVANFRLTPTVGGSAVLHAANYNSYSPTLTGTGASGTWGINITGNANTASLAIWSNQYNFSTAGAGWYRVATTGSDGRGTYNVELYCTGGNHNPALLQICAQGDWGGDKIVYANWDGSFPANAVRITRGASNTFLEVYFTTAIIGATLRINRSGFDTTITPYTGSLPAGGDTVKDTLDVTAKINASTLSVSNSATAIRLASGHHIGMGDWGLRNTTPYGWIQFGPANSSWCHIYGSQAFYFNQDLYTNGALQLHSSNYSSYALPLSGGTLTGALRVQGLGTSNPTTADGTDNSILSLRATNALVRLQFGTRNTGNYAGWIQASYDNGGGANGLEPLELNPLGGTVNANGNAVLHAGNYTSYSPSLTGSGASGTWGINITGNAATATSATDSTKLPLSGGTLTGLLTMSGFANPHFTVTTSGGDYSYIRLWDGSSSGYLIKNVSSGTGNGMLAGSLYLYTDQNKPVQIVHAGTSNAAFLSGGDVYVRGQIYAAGNGASTGSQVLHAGNYTSYSPSLTGSGASGTWGINITGNADTVDSLHASSFSRKDTTSQWIKPYYEYTQYLTSETPANLRDQMGGGGLRVDFLHPSYTGSGGWNHVITWSGYNLYNMYQLGGHYDGGTGTDLWVRSEANHGGTSWTAWRKLLNSSNYNSYAPTLTGSGASGTWGISISGTSAEVNSGRFSTTAGSYNNAYTWIQFGSSGGYGLYFPGSGAMTHFYPNSPATYGSAFIEGSKNSYWGIMYNTGAGNAGWMTNGNTTGFYNHSYGWKYYHESGRFYSSDSTYGAGNTWSMGLHNTQNPVLYSSAGGAMGLLGVNSSGSYRWQIYGDGSTYGFLQSAWGAWDIQKTVNGQLLLRVSSTDYTALHSGNYSSYALPLSGGTVSGDIAFSNVRKGTVGVYDPAQTQAVWAMGPSYVLTNGGASNNYGNFYGLGWSYNPDYGGSGNNPQSKNGLGHQLLLMWAGVTKTAIGTGIWTDGNITATGNVTAYSDERLKKDWSLIESGFVDRLAVLRCGTYTRIDSGQRQAGVSAQNMREILPEVVSEDSDGTLALAYGNAALVSAVELAKELVALKHKVAELEARVH